MILPTPQGLNSTTFTSPLMDGSLSILEIIDGHAEQSPKHELFRYDDPTSISGYRSITWGDAIRAFHCTARHALSHFSHPTSGDTPVVGILANTSSIVYFSLIVGIMRAGLVPFPLSPRNSDIAIAHLIEATRIRYLYVSADVNTQSTSRSALLLLQQKGYAGVEVIAAPGYDTLFETDSEDRSIKLPDISDLDQDKVAAILHSSGSTSFPKPIYMSHRFVLQFGIMPSFGEWDHCGKIQAGHGAAMFHAMGFIYIPWAAATGLTLAFFNPTLPAAVATPERAIASIAASKCTFMLCAPMFLESWANDPASIEILKKLEVVSFGGGPLQSVVGDKLVQNGVNLILLYGLTEVGIPTIVYPKKTPEEGWAYFGLSGQAIVERIPLEEDPSLMRLVFRETPTYTIAFSNMMLGQSQAYDTQDLVQCHPNNPNVFRIYGRCDDQIMHSNGEKTNPGPIEDILKQDPHIESAVMFGRSKLNTGVIINPSVTELFDHAMEEGFKSIIWPTVERANKFAPHHSRIFKEMIIIAKPPKEFQLTAKGSLRRGIIVKDYAPEIEKAYKDFEQLSASVDGTSDAPSNVTLKDTTNMIRNIVLDIISEIINDTDNIFDAGADSLSAARIRTNILKALSITMPGKVMTVIPSDFVFEHPSILLLSSFIYGILLCGRLCIGTEVEEAPLPNLDDNANTIVKLHSSKRGEPPLIMLHGGGGNIYDLVQMQGKFSTGFWAIQVTPDTPLGSMIEQSNYYYEQIKSQQPHGPYRIGGYSASSIIACRLVHLLEANGDTVEQLVLIDQFPLMHLSPSSGFDIHTFEVHNVASRAAYVEHGIRGLCDMFRADTMPIRQKLADEVWNAFQGRKSSELAEMLATMMRKSMLLIMDFIASLPAPNGATNSAVPYFDALAHWLGQIKAGNVTLYVASEGVIQGIRQDAREEWRNLGVEFAMPKTRIVHVDANHFDIVVHEHLTEDIERIYL